MCCSSNSKAIQKGHILLRTTDPDIVDIKQTGLSKILQTEKLRGQFKKLLTSKNLKIKKYLYCCDAAEGQDDATAIAEFHRKCDGPRKTIVLIERVNGIVLGGYTDIPWTEADGGA